MLLQLGCEKINDPHLTPSRWLKRWTANGRSFSSRSIAITVWLTKAWEMKGFWNCWKKYRLKSRRRLHEIANKLPDLAWKDGFENIFEKQDSSFKIWPPPMVIPAFIVTPLFLNLASFLWNVDKHLLTKILLAFNSSIDYNYPRLYFTWMHK